MLKSELPLVSDNMKEIYAAVHRESKEAELIPNLIGTRLYDKKRGWGILWNVVFIILSLFCGKGLKGRKLKEAIEKTHAAFIREKEKIGNIFARYRRCLDTGFDQESVDNTEFVTTRYAVHEWNCSTSPFIKLTATGKNKRLTDLLQNCFSADKKTVPFSFFEPTAKYQALIDIESVVGQPLPYSLLKKCAKEEELSGEEKRRFDRWITELNSHSKELTPRRFHKALAIIAGHVNGSEGTLAAALAERHCLLTTQNDTKQIAWRSTLDSGSVVTCNGKEIILNAKLGEDKSDDKKLVFTIKDDPDKVVIIAQNPMALAVQQHEIKTTSWGVVPADWHEVDKSGTVAIVERLSLPLAKIKWKSITSLADEDKAYADPLVAQVAFFLEQEATPEHLSADTLMFSNAGTLKTTKAVKRNTFLDFPALEQFVLACVTHNPVLFAYITKESGMRDHRYATFFREVVQTALDDDEIDPASLAVFSRHQITEPKIIDRAKKLYEEVAAAKNGILIQLLNSYQIPDVIAAGQWIKEAMLSSFQEKGTICLLPEHIEALTIHKMVEEHSLKENVGVR